MQELLQIDYDGEGLPPSKTCPNLYFLMAIKQCSTASYA